MKGATKAMVAMNKVSTWAPCMRTSKSSSYCFADIGFELAFNYAFSPQQMEPAKQAKVVREFQKQSAQMDMTVNYIIP